MKKLINNIVYASLFTFMLVCTSCQEEFEEINGGNSEQENFEASSNTAELIINTSLNDGSFDNIVDRASCFAIQFPYTVDVGGIQITIDSIADLELIEAIFDEFDDDVDELEILFPITITMADYTEIVIDSKEQLREMAAECLEGGEDEDIECIDFVYPITLFTFDVNEQQTGAVEVNSDRELRQFFRGLEDNAIVSLDYPVTLKKYDGTEIMVNSNVELATALERAKDECDEDDDDDFNDDDFDEERFYEHLLECPWKVLEIRRNAMDQTAQYQGYLLKFFDNGGVVASVAGDRIAEGIWDARITDDGVLLVLEFDGLDDFNKEWLVYEIGEGELKFYSDDDNKIFVRRLCEEEQGEADTLREILKECAWVIRKVKNQGEEIDRLLGYEFQFLPDGVATLSGRDMVSEGTWEIGYNNEQVPSLLISFGEEPSVNFEWPLRYLDDARLKFYVEEIGYELILQRVCEDNANDGDVVEIRNTMMGGAWKVELFETTEVNATSEFLTYDFYFNAMHKIQVDENDNTFIEGLWRVLRNYDEDLAVYLNFGIEAPFDDLTGVWYISEISANQINLEYYDGGDEPSKVLILVKNN